MGLILARRLIQASAQATDQRRLVAREVVRYWQDELGDHFAQEEKLLIPLIPDEGLREKMVQDHRTFEEYVRLFTTDCCAPEALKRAGELLVAHVRWEERVLFPHIEGAATENELEALARQTADVEEARVNSTWAPRRGELMKARKGSSDKGI